MNIQTTEVAQLPKFLRKKGSIQLDNKYQGIWKDYVDVHNTAWKYYVLEI